MTLISWIVIGLIVGGVARLFMPGRDPIGILATLVLGIVGAAVGGWIWTLLFGEQQGVAWIGSILTAMALLWLYRRTMYRREGAVG